MVDRDRYSNSSTSTYSSNYYPSFSSTLLDAIYRSIDSGEVETFSDNYNDPMMRTTVKADKFNVENKTNYNVSSVSRRTTLIESDLDQMITANHRRAYTIDKWVMEKQAIEESRKIPADGDQLKVRTSRKSKSNSYSSSSSSEYFSSNSEMESVQRPKPIRTGYCSGFSDRTDKFITTCEFDDRGCLGSELKSKQENGGFLKTKSRALKIYGDFKKAKQPISPGKKLAGFLNSLFSGNGNNLKKSTKVVSNSDHDYSSPSLKSTVTTSTSTCSSASSFSRSCLSKTPSSSRKLSSNNINGVKRSVRFASVSMIIDDDDDRRRQGNNTISIYKENISSSIAEEDRTINNFNTTSTNKEEINTVRVVEKNRRVDEVARDFLRNYHKSSHGDVHFDEEEDEDDCASCASSDLFELDNLSSIGIMERVYADELPVYETTRLQDNNRAFANGMIVS